MENKIIQTRLTSSEIGERFQYLKEESEYRRRISNIKVGYSEAGYTIMGNKGKYWIDDVQKKLQQIYYKSLGDAIFNFNYFLKQRTEAGFLGYELILIMKDKLHISYDDFESYFKLAESLGMKYNKEKKLWFGKLKLTLLK